MVFLRLCLVAAALVVGIKCAGDIYVTSGTASSTWSNSATWAIDRGYSLKGATPSPSTCFCSKSGNGQWAILNIPNSQVSKVRLLSYDAKMQGTYVQICQSNANCRQCGTQSPVNTGGMWTEFICERGVSGDQIKVIKDQSWVAFCEVEVYGSEYYVDKGHQIFPISATATSTWGSGWVVQNGYTNQYGTESPNTCYCSKNKGSNSASLFIPISYVKEVKLMAYTSSSIQNTYVEVCKDQYCSQCGGPAPRVNAKTWVSFTCISGIEGNTIKISRSGDYLGFCEAQIWSTGSGYDPNGPDNGGGSGDDDDWSDDDPATIMCKNSCTDYHRFCRRLFDANFDADYEKFLRSDEAKRLNLSPHRAPEGDCHSSGFYQQFCPKSCGTCNC